MWHLHNAGQWYTMNPNLLNSENLRELNDENSLSLVVKNPTHSSLNNVLLTERCNPITLLLQMITAIYNLTGFPTQLAITVHCSDETICFQDSPALSPGYQESLATFQLINRPYSSHSVHWQRHLSKKNHDLILLQGKRKFLKLAISTCWKDHVLFFFPLPFPDF